MPECEDYGFTHIFKTFIKMLSRIQLAEIHCPVVYMITLIRNARMIVHRATPGCIAKQHHTTAKSENVS